MKRLLHAPLTSPLGLLVRAALIALVFVVFHLCGLHADTTVLSDTSPVGDPADAMSVVLGFLSVIAWLAFVLFVPILVLAAGIFAALERVLQRTWTSSS